MERPTIEPDENLSRTKGRFPFARHLSAAADTLRETRKAWPGLSLYERFEEVVVMILTGLIGLVIVAAVINLCFRVRLPVIFGLLRSVVLVCPQAREALVPRPASGSRHGLADERNRLH